VTNEREPTTPETVSCDICLKQVPASEAQSPEASDYVLYFCGLDCYEQWKQQQPESFEQAIVRLNSAVTEAFNRGDVETCVESYAEDAILMLAGRPPIKGRGAIESFLREYASAGAKLGSVDPIATRSSGEMGCCVGTYEFTLPSKNGAPASEQGKFVTVFMRQSDGSWKVVVDSLIRG
jgi:uncharacterized protein (TIGR02246 family)